MERQKKNWLIAAIVIIALIAILIAWFTSSRAGQGSAGETKSQTTGSQTPGGSENEGAANSSSGSQSGQAADQGGDNLKLYMDEQDAIMAKMMEDMHNVPETGSAAIHFLKGMIPHHESAIEMAESYLEYGGQNQELKKIAEDIIAAQKKEIQDMNRMITEIEENGQKDEDKEKGYIREYDKMMASHHQSGHSGHTAPSDVEQAFAEGMILHHQMAVEMAEGILEYADEEDVRKLAQDIIDVQEKEIGEMQDIINGSGNAH